MAKFYDNRPIITRSKLKNMAFQHERWLKSKDRGDRARFSNVQLIELDLSQHDWAGAIFQYSRFSEVVMDYGNFAKAVFNTVTFNECSARFADFRKAEFRGLNLRQLDVFEADFEGADLRCRGDGRFVVAGEMGIFNYVFTMDLLQIGEERHPIETWRKALADPASAPEVKFLGADERKDVKRLLPTLMPFIDERTEMMRERAQRERGGEPDDEMLQMV